MQNTTTSFLKNSVLSSGLTPDVFKFVISTVGAPSMRCANLSCLDTPSRCLLVTSCTFFLGHLERLSSIELYAFAVVNLDPVFFSMILGSMFCATESPTYRMRGLERYLLSRFGADDGGCGADVEDCDAAGIGPLLPGFVCCGACDGALEDADVGGGVSEDLVHGDGPGANGGCGGEVEDFECSGSLLCFLLTASASKLS